MASGLPGVVVLLLCIVFSRGASAAKSRCSNYEYRGTYYVGQICRQWEFCCGSCSNRYCCSEERDKFSEDEQEECDPYESYIMHEPVAMFFGIGALIIVLLIFICCCVCPCCCLYKICCKPRPVVATTTHTTVVTTSPQQYPQQPTAVPQPSYPGHQYPSYQSVPQQPGYGIQPMPQAYGGQPMHQAYHQAPPTYQEATGPGYSTSPMPYSQAAYSPGQPAYPLQPPCQPQPNAPPAQPDFLSQPAYNPDYVPPKTG